MKKEIPRLLKSASIVYAFDCFGTVFSGTIFRKSSTVLFDPSSLGIRWIMLIPDSFWCKLKAKMLCRLYAIDPVEIIKVPKWKLKKHNHDALVNVLINIPSSDKSLIHYINPVKVKKIIYINNDLTVNNYVNENIHRSLYDVVAVNVIDFWQNKFSHLI